MRRSVVLLLTVLLAAGTVAVSAQKKKPAPPPPPTWSLTLPGQFDASPEGTVPPPTFFTDGTDEAGTPLPYVNGVGGLVVTTKVVLESTIGTYTQVDLSLPGASGRRVGVQGITYGGPLYDYGGTMKCLLPNWIDERTIGQFRVDPVPGCLVNFMGGAEGFHLHPPAPYDRFHLKVQLRGIDISAVEGTDDVSGFVDTWFGDYSSPAGVCEPQDWSSVAGAFLSSADQYTVTRLGPTSWRVFVHREHHGFNESMTTVTGTGKRAKCSSAIIYTEKTGPIDYWFDIGY